jgi:hypothetical protein
MKEYIHMAVFDFIDTGGKYLYPVYHQGDIDDCAECSPNNLQDGDLRRWIWRS